MQLFHLKIYFQPQLEPGLNVRPVTRLKLVIFDLETRHDPTRPNSAFNHVIIISAFGTASHQLLTLLVEHQKVHPVYGNPKAFRFTCKELLRI